jgi:hypothetical protein
MENQFTDRMYHIYLNAKQAINDAFKASEKQILIYIKTQKSFFYFDAVF